MTEQGTNGTQLPAPAAARLVAQHLVMKPYIWSALSVHTHVHDVDIINPEFVLLTGDLINEGELEGYQGYRYFSKAQRVLGKFQTPVFLTSGNHDLGGWDFDASVGRDGAPQLVAVLRLEAPGRSPGGRVRPDAGLQLRLWSGPLTKWVWKRTSTTTAGVRSITGRRRLRAGPASVARRRPGCRCRQHLPSAVLPRRLRQTTQSEGSRRADGPSGPRAP